MASSVIRRVTSAWNRFSHPQDIGEAFIISIAFLQVGGMFPYAVVDGQFKISYLHYGITLAHISAYTLVNITLLQVDVLIYAKPLVVDSTVAIAVNILNKTLGLVLTLVIYLPILLGTKRFTNLLNQYIVLFDGLAELGIEAKHVYRKILVLSGVATVTVFSMSLYMLMQSCSFYEKLTGEQASIRFFYVVVLSQYYKNMCLYALVSYVFSSVLVLKLLNEFLEQVLRLQDKVNQTGKVLLSEFRL